MRSIQTELALSVMQLEQRSFDRAWDAREIVTPRVAFPLNLGPFRQVSGEALVRPAPPLRRAEEPFYWGFPTDEADPAARATYRLCVSPLRRAPLQQFISRIDDAVADYLEPLALTARIAPLRTRIYSDFSMHPLRSALYARTCGAMRRARLPGWPLRTLRTVRTRHIVNSQLRRSALERHKHAIRSARAV